MIVTFILSFILMAALFLMIWAAVALVQSKRLFTTAPKDIQTAALEHEERFPGARILGWLLLVIFAAAFLGAFVYGGWDGIQRDYGFWQFFGRFLTMLYLLKAFDISGCLFLKLVAMLMPDSAFRLAFTNGLMSESMLLWFGSMLL